MALETSDAVLISVSSVTQQRGSPMTYVRYSPWTTLPRPVRDTALVPDVDVREAAEQYHISVDLPGVAPADISVTTEHGVLTIRAERQTAENIRRGRLFADRAPHRAHTCVASRCLKMPMRARSPRAACMACSK
jgi:hypothetical protein